MLKLLLNGSNIKGYTMSKLSKSFRKKYPKRFILSLLINGNHQTMNVDQIPPSLLFYNPVGYIFTYGKILPTFLARSFPTPDIGNTWPVSLDQYFNDSVNIVFQIQATNAEVSPTFVSDMIIRGNDVNQLEEYFNKNSIKHKSIESFIEAIIGELPLNCFMLPINYPKVITMKNINAPTKLKNMLIGYDFRPKSYEEEFTFINNIEKRFENPKRKIVLYQTYNNLLDKIKNKLQSNEYKQLDSDSIEISLETLWKLDIEYQITDLI
jgi:hypothetical protein